jgi:hypothetical protein
VPANDYPQYNALILAIKCPVCEAEPRERCRSSFGHKATRPHGTRVKAARALESQLKEDQ